MRIARSQLEREIVKGVESSQSSRLERTEASKLLKLNTEDDKTREDKSKKERERERERKRGIN